MAQAAAAMARMDREMRRRLADSKARRRGMIERHGRADPTAAAIPSRSDLACAWICGDCGLLSDASPTHCPACGSLHWLDLGDHAVADGLREVEDAARRKAPDWLRRSLISGSVVLVLTAWLLTGRNHLVLLGGVPVLTGFWLVALRPIVWAVLARMPHQPARWRFPIAGAAAPPAPAAGPAEASGPLLRAPFSRVECLAWRVGVLFDVEGDYRPPQWALAEARSAAMTVAGVTIAKDSVVFEGPLVPLGTDAAQATGLDLSSFLRERGLFAGDGSFLLFEACLEPGTEVESTGTVLRPRGN